MGDEKPLNNPLYGAPPPPTSSGSITTPTPTPTPTSTPAVNPDKSIPDLESTTNPLFGATPPPASSLSQLSAAPRIPPRTSRLPLSHPSGLPAYLRKLGYILSIVLGSSAVIAGVWSIFILPLLHASFSARKALVDQQKDRWVGLVSGLKEVRARAVYPPLAQIELASNLEGTVVRNGDGEKDTSALEKNRNEEEARLMDHEDSSDSGSSSEIHESLIPLKSIASLSTSLQNLTTAFTSTSTTRTSLLSTLESYTSYLHRQLYLRSQPSSGMGMRYGMNTLSANLAKAGGKSSWGAYDQSTGEGEGSVGVKGEEWDAVRKEVRAIKGMLLSRRNFMTEGEAR